MQVRERSAQSGLEYEYTPKALGNESDPEPLRVVLSVPTERQRRNFYGHATQDSLSTLDTHWEAKYRAIKACVLEVKNFWRFEGEKKIMITTAADFCEYAQDEFVGEVGDEIILGLSLTDREAETAKK